ncbi:disulfide bond formation protein DsbA [Candidatus Pacearchaeota archaeon CG10_big_fil_rev_8_21_14_0_10_34_12]|nr:MAG: disulfide bond formation protein DsbA [Candidatus Pacearchaeota archaeon CG10_big_fil_rev_8_21_14_0_10_34_12]
MSDEKTITIKKDDLWKYSTFALIAILVIGAVFMFAGNSGSGTTTTEATQPTQPSGKISASIDDDAVLGEENAKVTIIEFSDFQCPFCRKFWSETMPLIKSEYIDTGKVRFVYRDFPLTGLHPMAIPSAEAAECARDIYGEEAFWKMHDEIFAQQNILDSGSREGPVRSTVSYTTTDLKEWAKDIGYNIDSCLDSGKFTSEVQKDLSDATAAGGQGTPYFVINGNPLSGAYPFSAFQQIIEAELAA